MTGVISAFLVFGVVFAGALDSRLFSFLMKDGDSDWVTVELKEQDKSELQDYRNMDDLQSNATFELETPKDAAAASAAAADTVLV